VSTIFIHVERLRPRALSTNVIGAIAGESSRRIRWPAHSKNLSQPMPLPGAIHDGSCLGSVASKLAGLSGVAIHSVLTDGAVSDNPNRHRTNPPRLLDLPVSWRHDDSTTTLARRPARCRYPFGFYTRVTCG